MTPFQWIAVPLLGLAGLRDLLLMLRMPEWRRFLFVRAITWTAAAVSIAEPVLPQRLADALEITRGADLVFYLVALAFLVASFVVYGRFQRMQRQITALTRTIALQQARRPDERE